jgi:hypothetical protein
MVVKIEIMDMKIRRMILKLERIKEKEDEA